MVEQNRQNEPEVPFRDWWYGRGDGIAALVTAVGVGVCDGAIIGVLVGMMLQGLPVVPDEQMVIQITAAIAALLAGAGTLGAWRFTRQHGGSADPCA